MNEPDVQAKERRSTKKKAPADKPKSRPKLRKAKNPTEIVDLDEEAKKEAESALAKVEDIESFRLAMLFGLHTITNILKNLAESRTKVERVIGQRMSLLAIAEHLNKENIVEDMFLC
ncbi:hypothetical protein R1flu_004227 [Riccia fluitans]|uniref:Uncharacterized protein n=1 Tax=Riccia fluitans TaxID=41844 RepID=A0ABD1YPP0_9MARC